MEVIMKKLMFLFAIVLITFSCEEYEFIDENSIEENNEALKVKIYLKSSQNEFANMDTAYIAVDIRVILKAVTINGEPNEWYWDLGDGTTSEGQQVDHLYEETGIYNVIVTAIDGSNAVKSEIVIVVESGAKAVFSLHSSTEPNSQGQIKYIVSGLKEKVPNPPVPENGPFGYEGSNSESRWDVVKISPDTSSTRVYWEVLTSNEVYSQAYGGFKNVDDFVWATMNDSRFFSNDYDHLRVGFLNGQIVEEENFQIEVLGDSGDDGDNPQVRFEVIENEDQINVYINIFDYSSEINSPKARFKVTKEDAWSGQRETEWIGGTGYVKYTIPINSAGEYRLRIEPDQNNPGTYTKMTNSKFYNSTENCFVWQFVEISG